MEPVRKLKELFCDDNLSFHYCGHAQKRMMKRGITTDDIKWVCTHPANAELQGLGLDGGRKFRVEGATLDGDHIAVVVEIHFDESNCTIVTVL